MTTSIILMLALARGTPRRSTHYEEDDRRYRDRRYLDEYNHYSNDRRRRPIDEWNERAARARSQTDNGHVPGLAQTSPEIDDVQYGFDPLPKHIDFKDLTREERKEVMRLPWTQWMNSDVKNRKSTPPALPYGKLTNSRLCCDSRRVCRDNHVPLAGFCRNPDSQHPIRRFGFKFDVRRRNRVQCYHPSLHLPGVWILADGQRLGVLPHLWWPI